MKTVLLIIVLLLLAIPVSAQDESGNECYAGGRMENQCTSDDLWTYGYYLHRFLEYNEPMPGEAGEIDGTYPLDPHPSGVWRCDIMRLLLRDLTPPQIEHWIAVNGCWVGFVDYTPFNPPTPPNPIIFPYCVNEPNGVCP
jgi:hypothetical protein